MATRITGMTEAVAGDLAATTTYMEVATNTTTAPLTRKISFGTLRDWLASAATGFAAVTITVASLHVTGTTQLDGSVGIGSAAAANRTLRVSATTTAASGTGFGIISSSALVAAANGDQLVQVLSSPGFTPGAFTGLIAEGLRIGSWSVAGFTSPADASQISIKALTGTGATNAFGILIAPPAGATNNYLLSHTTPATFSVKADGSILTAASCDAASYKVGGVAGTDFTGAVAAKSFTIVKGLVTVVA